MMTETRTPGWSACFAMGLALLGPPGRSYHGVQMAEIPTLFDRHASFDPAGDFEAFVKEVPARWVVYLLADGDDRPVQLLCVRNLRYSLKRRLGPEEAEAGPSR